jgi:hypothetical protein
MLYRSVMGFYAVAEACSIRDFVYGLPRIRLLGNSVNKGKKEGKRKGRSTTPRPENR